ncbi:hypothetical protein FQR65_LT12548 [Abscondita terminalis]|nr:hypothetical protein FQR65_LT12548 [Abscondita terminalis]
MDAATFENWLKQQLLPNLQEPSLIILDNASYHSRLIEKTPSSTWKKEELRNWLTTKQISFNDTDLKIKLLMNLVILCLDYLHIIVNLMQLKTFGASAKYIMG